MAAQPQYRETLLHAAELASELGDADLLAEAALTNTRGSGALPARSTPSVCARSKPPSRLSA